VVQRCRVSSKMGLGVGELRDGDKRVSVWQLDHGAFGCGRGWILGMGYPDTN
jgi:hypothetical protein